MVFGPRRKVIFVHGCFWHSHDDPACPLAHKPRSNLDYWLPKLERTKKRDQENFTALESAGWSVMEIWECELKELDSIEERLCSFLDG